MNVTISDHVNGDTNWASIKVEFDHIPIQYVLFSNDYVYAREEMVP